MPVSYGKGNMGKATKLHSLLVRGRGSCEKCGEHYYPALQAAHIVPRRYSATRTDTENAFCLCWTCHRRFTDWPMEWTAFVLDRIGPERYEALRMKATAGGKFGDPFWKAEVERLSELVKRMEEES